MTAMALAPAKVNLTLHVTGQRDDGFHLLESLVVFVDVGDRISVVEAETALSLTVSGNFAAGVPTGPENIVIRAAEVLRRARGVSQGAAISLEKHLPHPAGLGGGSSDAAAVLRLLAALWGVDPLAPDDPCIVTLGADVPVCSAGPGPSLMRGIGEILEPAPPLPPLAMALINPLVSVPTSAVFKALVRKENLPHSPLPTTPNTDEFFGWLKRQRNDLLQPACTVTKEIATCLQGLAETPENLFVGMSGSGATCFALYSTLDEAEDAVALLSRKFPRWWVAAGLVQSGDNIV